MALVDAHHLSKPAPESPPCGPDLSACEDDVYVKLFSDAGLLLPHSFFNPELGPFEPSKPDFNFQDTLAVLTPSLTSLLQRSRDIRLFELAARLAILKRDLKDFVRAVVVMAAWLETQWDQVHPRPEEGGSVIGRVNALEGLVQSTVTFSLQHTPLCVDKRLGAITYRAKVLKKPQEGKVVPLTEQQIVRALQAAGAEEIGSKRALYDELSATLKRIRAVFMEKTSGSAVPKLDNLSNIVQETIALLESAFPSPAATSAEKGNAEPAVDAADAQNQPAGPIGDAAACRRALESVINYFRHCEPSSPVLPLLAQARALHGKTFPEVLQILLPDHAQYAAYPIGEQDFFKLMIAPLSAELPPIDDYARATTPPKVHEQFHSPSPAASDMRSDETCSIPNLSESEVISHEDGREVEDGAPPVAAAPPPSHVLAAPVEATAKFSVANRVQALALLNAVSAYLRDAEPASPIPWLLDRAQTLAERDFLSVLTSVLPAGTLSSLNKE